MKGNVGNIGSYTVVDEEAEWIRNGEPIEFEGTRWFPQDGFDVLMDNEMYLLGEYKGVQFFVEKIDVRPYNRLYTKFNRNKFRFFQKETINDQGPRPF